MMPLRILYDEYIDWRKLTEQKKTSWVYCSSRTKVGRNKNSNFLEIFLSETTGIISKFFFQVFQFFYHFDLFYHSTTQNFRFKKLTFLANSLEEFRGIVKLKTFRMFSLFSIFLTSDL